MKVLVTGGAGFIGSHYVRTALTGGYAALAEANIVVLDALTYAGNQANLAEVASSDRLVFVHGDIRDAKLVDDLTSECDEVVHFAAESHVDRSIAGSAEFVSTNVTGTQVLLDAALRNGVERFVQVSTDEVYGSITEGSWSEDQPLAPSSPYSASKAAADLLALAYVHTHGLPLVVTRCSNNYGPYQYPEKVIPLFVTNLLDGLSVPLYGDGLNVRDWLHVHDHCRGIELARTGGRVGEIYHLGGGREMTNRELTALLLRGCGADDDRVQSVPDRPGHDRRYSLGIGKARAELGYEPEIGFEAGLAETIDWYRTNREWWEPLKAADRI